MITYTNSLADITPDQLAGFFVGWPDPPSPATHLALLEGSYAVELALDDAGHGGQDLIGRAGADDDEIEFVRIDVRHLERPLCSNQRQRRRRLPFHRDMAALDARALANPFVRGVDHLFEVGISNQIIGKTSSGTADF